MAQKPTKKDVKEAIDKMTASSGLKVQFSPGIEKDFRRLFSRNPVYAIPRWFSEKKFDLKMAWQRAYRGYSDDQVWGLHSHLEDFMPKAIEHLLKWKHGTPAGLTIQQWHGILRKIKRGFEAAGKISNMDFVTNYVDSEGKKKFYYNHAIEARLRREFDEGFKLFNQHFFSLWD